jgi:hypothetical protein
LTRVRDNGSGQPKVLATSATVGIHSLPTEQHEPAVDFRQFLTKGESFS